MPSILLVNLFCVAKTKSSDGAAPQKKKAKTIKTEKDGNNSAGAKDTDEEGDPEEDDQ